ncbi:MAG: nuclear transport factor 2 family protein [Gaiellaceae bacterium]
MLVDGRLRKAVLMVSRLVERVFRAVITRLNTGDPRPVVRLFANDARFVFPGESSFGGDHRGRAEIGAWFERFAALGPHFTIHDVTVAGPPWNMRAAVQFSDRIAVPGGNDYTNEGVIWLRMRWGRVLEDRTYLDTQRVASLDAQLESAA